MFSLAAKALKFSQGTKQNADSLSFFLSQLIKDLSLMISTSPISPIPIFPLLGLEKINKEKSSLTFLIKNLSTTDRQGNGETSGIYANQENEG
jgi:hypothetical protein